jgi:peptidoglycan/xylan/chitin deacetylase (PgdA/CDA1 family)
VWRLLGLAVLTATVAGGCASGFLLPEDDLLRNVYLRGSPSAPTVALTFDDGPNGRCTEAVLDALRDVGAPATFFVLGRNVERGQADALLARMLAEGHAIGVHSHTHAVRPLFLHDLTAYELAAARTAVADALARAGVLEPPACTFFRPPFGLLTEASATAAGEAGFRVVEWTISVGDWKRSRRPEDVTAAILAQVRAGDVIVLHDGNGTHQSSLERCRDRPNAAAVVRQLVPALAARGLRPAPLAEVLGLPQG